MPGVGYDWFSRQVDLEEESGVYSEIEMRDFTVLLQIHIDAGSMSDAMRRVLAILRDGERLYAWAQVNVRYSRDERYEGLFNIAGTAKTYNVIINDESEL